MKIFRTKIQKVKRILAWSMIFTMLCTLLGCGAADVFNGIDEPKQKQTVYLPETYTHKWIHKQFGYTDQTRYSYDEKGRIISVVTTRTYDHPEELSKSEGNFVNSASFTYDEHGNMTCEHVYEKITHADGSTTETTEDYTYAYTYDKNGQVLRCVTTITWDGKTQTESDYAFTYDRQGNLVLAVSQDGMAWQSYEYDSQKRLVEETMATENYFDGSWNYTHNTYRYDSEGKVAEYKGYVAHAYMDVGPEGLDELELENQYVYTCHYDQQGRLVGYNDRHDVYKYDENGHHVLEEVWSDGLSHGKPVERLIERYTLDENGNVAKFENYISNAEITYVTQELDAKDAYAARRAFNRSFEISHSIGPTSFSLLWFLYPQDLRFDFSNRSQNIQYYCQLIRNPLC